MPFAVLNSSANLHRHRWAPRPCSSASPGRDGGSGSSCRSQVWAAPTCPPQHPRARLCPCPAASGKERALSTSYFPVGLYFSFHHLLTLDVEIRAGVHRAEKVLSIFFPSCRHQKGIVGSIAFYITGGFDPLSIGDINLPLFLCLGVDSFLCSGVSQEKMQAALESDYLSTIFHLSDPSHNCSLCNALAGFGRDCRGEQKGEQGL